MGVKRGRGKGGSRKVPPKPPSLDGMLQAEATAAAVAAMIPVMEGLIEKNQTRMIRTMAKTDLEWMAVAAITGWVLKRAEQAKAYDQDCQALIGDVNEMGA